MSNYNEVLKGTPKFISRVSKKTGKRNYYIKVELTNGKDTEIFADKEVFDFIEVAKDCGIEQPIKSFDIQERLSEKTGEKYTALILKTFDDNEYFYFFSRPFHAMIKLLAAQKKKSK